MTATILISLSPLILLSASIIIVMLTIAFYRNHLLTALLASGGILLTGISLVWAENNAPHQVTDLIIVDKYGLFLIGLLLAANLVIVFFSYLYLQKQSGNREEFYLLLLLALLGSMVLVESTHFASFFLGLEILSVSLYGLIAYPRVQAHSIEAGLKYLILAAASASFLVFGMGLIYADQGTMVFNQLSIAQTGTIPSVLMLAGLGLIIVGLGYKLALVPFHMWAADVYQGAPAMVTAFIATISKGAVFALLLRLFRAVELDASPALFLVFVIIAILSMLGGNLLALRQDNVKRILAYSSIAHLGYLLVAFLAGGSQGTSAAIFYLVVYFVTTLGAFAVVGLLSGSERDADRIEDYTSLYWRKPWLAAIMTANLLSLAGIPLTAGFAGKFYLLMAGIGAAAWVLAITLVVSSAIGLYYYLRIIVAMFQPLPEEGVQQTPTAYLPLAGSLALAVLLAVMVWLGIYPTPLIDWILSLA
jgi:NADH-quinone oxidoreductase subunit N